MNNQLRKWHNKHDFMSALNSHKHVWNGAKSFQSITGTTRSTLQGHFGQMFYSRQKLQSIGADAVKNTEHCNATMSFLRY